MILEKKYIKKIVVWLKESCALHENHKLGSRIYCSEAIKSPKVGAVRVDNFSKI
jgi:hypothetical protein